MEIRVIASGSKGNCYVVSDGVTKLLLDCGVSAGVILKNLNWSVAMVKGCLVTHEHGDHVKGAKELQKYGIPIYGSPGTLMGADIKHGYEVAPRKIFTLGTFHIKPFETQHDSLAPYGYLLKSEATGETLLYFTDTYYLKYCFGRLDYIIGECNYDINILNEKVESGGLDKKQADRIIKSHMSIDHLLNFLKMNDTAHTKQVWLCHLSDRNSNEADFKRRVQELTGAEVYVC